MNVSKFGKSVESVVASVPFGKVVTYGQVAAMIGHPRAARQVGGVAHYGNLDIPWHRLVNRFGGLASGYHGGREAQQQHLEAEGVQFTETDKGWVLDIDKYIWVPDN